MKVAILSESAADQAAVHIIVNALLGRPAELYDRPYRTHGWSTVFRLLPGVLKELHYNRTDVDALIVVMDSDQSVPHAVSHDAPGASVDGCRLCELREVIAHTQNGLTATGRTPVKVAIGLAVPCIEAWLSCGRDPHVTEAAWSLALSEKRFPYTCNKLKQSIYGTDRPGIGLETNRMREEATRLVTDIDRLKAAFPGGFGSLAAAVQSW